MNSPLKVCYILSYYSPDYTRTCTLVAALKHIEGLQLFEARNSSDGLRRYLETLVKLVVIRLRHRPDVFFLGFRGYEIYWLVRLLTVGKPLYYDHMMSPYDSLTNETQVLSRDGIVAKVMHAYERSILHNATFVLTDTFLNKRYFETEFGIPSAKTVAVHVGADESIFLAKNRSQRKLFYTAPFTALFYGSFLPLHGVDVILGAAALLKDEAIMFKLIGGNRLDLSDFYQRLNNLELNNVSHQSWVDYQLLPKLIEESDVCLGGPFGNTGQARRVITGKSFQSLAMGKATIIGKIDEDYGFRDKVNCLLVQQGSAEKLADTLSWAASHRERLPGIGAAGRKLYLAEFSRDCIANRLEGLIVL